MPNHSKNASGHDVPDPVDSRRRAQLGTLTRRELEVLSLLSTGAPAKAIGERLEITRPTVKRHLTNPYRTLGVTNRVEAARCYLLTELDPSTPDPSERQRPNR